MVSPVVHLKIVAEAIDLPRGMMPGLMWGAMKSSTSPGENRPATRIFLEFRRLFIKVY